jgi:hypothetical protein
MDVSQDQIICGFDVLLVFVRNETTRIETNVAALYLIIKSPMRTNTLSF